MRCQETTTLLQGRDELRGVGRIATSNEVADFDQIALGMLGEP